jgi:CheY-like chemotaxis protein
MARAKRNTDPRKLQGKRILVVEDDPLISEGLAYLLSRYGYPSEAHSGRDALEQIEHKAPDLILLDLCLPDMNGLEVARVVRQNEKTKSIPILAMSGTPMDKRKCLQMGCNVFIHKPFSVASLLLQLLQLICY